MTKRVPGPCNNCGTEMLAKITSDRWPKGQFIIICLRCGTVNRNTATEAKGAKQ
jgi:hypothetical protein